MTDDELFAELAERLRLVQARVGALKMPEAEKSLILRRFRTITDAAKHDLGTAAKRLDAFVEELDRRHAPD